MTKTKAESFLKKLEENRPKILSDKARAYGKSLTKDKKKAQAFMQKAGILDKDGKLTPEYRST